MGGLFAECSSLSELPDISKWNTENVTTMNGLFWKCSSLSLLPDISKWNIKNVTNAHLYHNYQIYQNGIQKMYYYG